MANSLTQCALSENKDLWVSTCKIATEAPLASELEIMGLMRIAICS